MPGRQRVVGALILFIAAPAAVLSGSCAVEEIVPQCGDGIKNGDETGLDCGGPICDPCEGSMPCTTASDCPSGVCSDQVCATPSCDDDVANGDETDLDCGGSCNATCALGQKCGATADCASSFCTGSVCVDQAHNLVKDGDETDTDCGGSSPTKCSVGRVCTGNADCFSNVCTQNLCTPDPTAGCFDALKNGSETDVDCGGGACAPCVSNQSCLVDSDCKQPLSCKGVPAKTCHLL